MKHIRFSEIQDDGRLHLDNRKSATASTKTDRSSGNLSLYAELLDARNPRIIISYMQICQMVAATILTIEDRFY